MKNWHKCNEMREWWAVKSKKTKRKEWKRGRNQIAKNLSNFIFFSPLLTDCQLTKNKWETAGNLKKIFSRIWLEKWSNARKRGGSTFAWLRPEIDETRRNHLASASAASYSQLLTDGYIKKNSGLQDRLFILWLIHLKCISAQDKRSKWKKYQHIAAMGQIKECLVLFVMRVTSKGQG